MTKHDYIKSIISAIKLKRESAIRQTELDLIQAMTYPDFKQLDIERRNLLKTLISDPSNDFNSVSKKYDEIIVKLDNIAKQHNLSPFSPLFNCSICEDTGYLSNGELCSCAKKMLFDTMKKINGYIEGFPYNFNMHNPDLLKGTEQEKNVEKLLSYLKKYSLQFPTNTFLNLTLSGGTGTGKTFALSAVGNAVLERGFFALFVTSFELHNAFLRYHTAPMEEKSLYMDNLLDAELLIIDDLGKEPIFKNVTLEYLDLLLSERLTRGLATLVSTNLGPDNILERYGERIFSRLLDKRHSKLIDMSGDDLRFRRS